MSGVSAALFGAALASHLELADLLLFSKETYSRYVYSAAVFCFFLSHAAAAKMVADRVFFLRRAAPSPHHLPPHFSFFPVGGIAPMLWRGAVSDYLCLMKPYILSLYA